MMRIEKLLLPIAALILLAGGCSAKEKTVSISDQENKAKEKMSQENKTKKTKEEWQTCLTPEEYRIAREKGTEMAFTGKYYNHHEDGIYKCIC